MQSRETLVLRAAHVSEAGQLASMSRLLVEHGLRWRWTARRVRAAVADPDTMVLVASLAGEIAGFAIMSFGDREAHLLLLAVSPERRRTGAGRQMLAWLEKSAITAGIHCIRLEVRTANAPARAFYRRLGYRYLGQLSGYYDGREAASIYAKSLLARDG